MNSSWTDDQRRHYLRIVQGLELAGLSSDEAQEYARGTIEDMRIRPRKPDPDPNNPTKDELYREAMRYNIAGRSKMDKDELFAAVRDHRSSVSTERPAHLR